MSLDSFVKLQENILERLSRAKTNYNKSPKDRITKQYVETRLESVEEFWAQFSSTHSNIIKDFKSEDVKVSSYNVNNVFYNTEDLYLEHKCELKIALIKFKGNDVSPVAGSSSVNASEFKNVSVKLPKLTIPVFSGKYTEWPTFRDLFVSAIHKNITIDKVQKLHYLKGYLTGEAEQLLRHIPISADNYDSCWSQLETRYNNKKYLSHCILKRLFSQRNILCESAKALKELLDTTTECLNALVNLGVSISSWDILIIHILTLKLDAESRKEWELKVASDTDLDKLPTFKQFSEFLTSRYRAFEFLENKPMRTENVSVTKAKTYHTTILHCQLCNDDHKLGNCKEFVNKDVETRRKFVQDSNLCFNCLGYNHSARFCKCTASCRICKRRHHSLLHPTGQEEALGKSDSSKNKVLQTKEYTHTIEVEDQELVTCFSKGITNNQVLLATALVRAVSRNGYKYTVRALLDQGSQASFITEHVVQSLGLKKIPAKGLITGIDVSNKLPLNSVVEVKIQSRIDPSFELVVKAYVIKSITSLLPVRETAYLDWAQVNDIELADSRYHTPDKVDMLLGAEIYSLVIQNGLKKVPGGSTIAQRTSLGWILSGTVASAAPSTSHITVMHAHVGDDEILKRFWELEKEPNETKKRILTEEETKCEEIFKATTVRNENGQYVVNLPFRSDDPSCKYGDSRNIAIRRFHALENKLNKNMELKAKYAEVINEYLHLGHMKPISEIEKQNKYAVYLPHHAIVRNDRDTTKVSVVFDASCKGSNGISLNDDQMIGPRLQSDLRHLLIRWRTHRIRIISDIGKTNRMVHVTDKHKDFQRIVRRESQDSAIKDYKLLTVTFGTSSAPSLAVWSLQQVAYDEGKNYPLAAERLLNYYYVDVLMSGCNTIKQGIDIYRQMNQILGKAGFKLQKWPSNSNELLNRFISEMNEDQVSMERGSNIKQDEIMKTLGLTWNRSCDTFQYSIQLPPLQEPVTKRIVLADIARLFDPFGWVANVMVIAKMQIQKLWISGIGWDKEIAAALAIKGTTWYFIPPHTPNFGGLWKAGIKSCKKHLHKVIGSFTLTNEEMSTLLSQEEACLNSRLLYILTDSTTFNALAPGHFLISDPIVNALDYNFEDANISSLKRWHSVQQMMQHFWRRWSVEYLITLRYKWSKQRSEPNLWDIVLIKENNLPLCHWLLGRVIKKQTILLE